VLRRLVGLQTARRLPSIDDWESQIHQDEIGPARSRHRDGLLTIDGEYDLKSPALQAASQRVTTRVVVFD
jgi:hypothetical protein